MSFLDIGNLVLKASVESSGFDSFISSLTKGLPLGAQLAGKAVTELTKVCVECVNVFASVDKQMRLTYQTMGATAEEQRQLFSAVSDAASKSVYSFGEAATATLNFARAGLDAAEAANALSPAMALAAGEGGNLDVVSQGLVSTINGFKGSFDEAGRYADVFANACNNSALDIDSLTSNISKAVPIFQNAGWNIEDLTTAMGIMGNNGIDAATASNTLSVSMTRLIAPTDEAAKYIQRLGLELENPDGTIKPFSEVIDQLRTSFQGLTDVERQEYAAKIFGKEQMKNMLPLITSTTKEYNDLRASLGQANTAMEMQAAQMEGMGGQLDQLSSTTDVLKTNIGDLLSSEFLPLVESMVNITTGAKELTDAIKGLRDKFEDLPGPIQEVGRNLAGVFNPLVALTNAARHMNEIIDLFPEKGKEYAGTCSSMAEEYKRLHPEIEGVNDAIKDEDQLLEELEAEQEAEAKAIEDAQKAFEEANKALHESTTGLLEYQDAADQLTLDQTYENIVDQVEYAEQMASNLDTIFGALDAHIYEIAPSLANSETARQDFLQWLENSGVLTGKAAAELAKMYETDPGKFYDTVSSYHELYMRQMGAEAEASYGLTKAITTGNEEASQSTEEGKISMVDSLGQINAQILSTASSWGMMPESARLAFLEAYDVTSEGMNMLNEILTAPGDDTDYAMSEYFEKIPLSAQNAFAEAHNTSVQGIEEVKNALSSSDIESGVEKITGSFTDAEGKIKTSTNNMKTSVDTATKGMVTSLNTAAPQISSETKVIETSVNSVGTTIDNSKLGDKLNTQVSAMVSALSSNYGAFASQIDNYISKLTELANAAASAPGSISIGGLPASNATGIDYVPEDGYVAELHRGEMVLDRNEAENYRSSQTTNNNVTQNFNITVPSNENAVKTALKLRKLVREQQYGVQGV